MTEPQHQAGEIAPPSSSDSNHSSASLPNVWMWRGVLLATLLVCGIALSPTSAGPDLWGHVQYGRDLLREGVPETTTYSFTADGYRWINHENLAEVCYALLVDTIGPRAMVSLRCALGIGILLCLVRKYRQLGLGLMATCGMLVLLSNNLASFWTIRPQLFSFVLFALLLGLLNYCFQGWEGKWRLPWLRSWMAAPDELSQEPSPEINHALGYQSKRLRWLWLGVPLMCIWANAHGGFLAGLCIYVAYLMLRAFEAFATRGRESFGLVRRLVLMAVVAALATLVNPYGPNLHLWLVQSLGVPRPEITEWQPLSLLSNTTLFFFVMLGVFTVTLIGSRKSRDFTHLVLFGLVLCEAIQHQRHIPFFAFMFAFWMPQHVQSLLNRFRKEEEPDAWSANLPLFARRTLAPGLTILLVLLGVGLYRKTCDMPVQNSRYPVEAMQFIADHELSGKMVVTYNWAQYVIAAFGDHQQDHPHIEVSFDGRFRTCYPQELVDQHFDFVLGPGPLGTRFRSDQSGPLDENAMSATLQYEEPNLVLIDRHQIHSVEVMQQHGDQWTLLYQDSLAQVWGRASHYDNITSANYLPPDARQITERLQEGTTTWPAFPVPAHPSTRLVDNTSAARIAVQDSQ